MLIFVQNKKEHKKEDKMSKLKIGIIGCGGITCGQKKRTRCVL